MIDLIKIIIKYTNKVSQYILCQFFNVPSTLFEEEMLDYALALQWPFTALKYILRNFKSKITDNTYSIVFNLTNPTYRNDALIWLRSVKKIDEPNVMYYAAYNGLYNAVKYCLTIFKKSDIVYDKLMQAAISNKRNDNLQLITFLYGQFKVNSYNYVHTIALHYQPAVMQFFLTKRTHLEEELLKAAIRCDNNKMIQDLCIMHLNSFDKNDPEYANIAIRQKNFSSLDLLYFYGFVGPNIQREPDIANYRSCLVC